MKKPNPPQKERRIKGSKLHVGDLELFSREMDKAGVIKTKTRYHDPIFSLLGMDVIQSQLVPKSEAWLVSPDGEILKKFSLVHPRSTISFTPPKVRG